MLFSKPVIAAVEGYAVAGGMELALMCDMRVVDENAIMGVYCRRFGEISTTIVLFPSTQNCKRISAICKQLNLSNILAF